MRQFSLNTTALTRAVIAMSMVCFAGHANAQDILDVETAVTQGSIFEDALSQSDQQRQLRRDEAVIAGEPGVFVLNRNNIFNVGVTAGGGFSTNPFQTSQGEEETAAFGNVGLSAGVNTRIADKVDFGANLVGTLTEFESGDGPSNRNLIFNSFVGKSVPVLGKQVYASLSGAVGVNTDEDFENPTTFTNLSLGVSSALKPIKTVIVQPSVAVSRQWSEVSEQDNFAVQTAVAVSWAIRPKWQVAGNVGYTYRSYDNFFEDVTLVARKDNVVSVGVSVARALPKNLRASVSFGYTNQDSRFFLSNYDGFTGGLRLNLRQKF